MAGELPRIAADCCSAAALLTVVFQHGPLHFCQHHFDKNSDAIYVDRNFIHWFLHDEMTKEAR